MVGYENKLQKISHLCDIGI